MNEEPHQTGPQPIVDSATVPAGHAAVGSNTMTISKSASRTLESARQIASRSVYLTCYSLSYGVSFPTLMVVGLVPKHNPVYHGFVDGYRAAQETVQRIKTRRATIHHAAQEAWEQTPA